VNYRRDVDGLRALAVTPVVLYHAGLSGFSGGFVGVDVFFVISGYVIAGSLLVDLDGERFSLWRFYEKRVRRIFPALMLMFACSYVAALLFLIPDHFVNFSRSIVASATFFANFFFWKNEGYFDLSAHLRPLLHTWSLAIEEQFYLFAPLMMWLVYKKLDRRWLATIMPLLLSSLALSVYATRLASTANFFLLPTRAWELLVGVLLALRPPVPLSKPWFNETVAFVGFSAIAWAVIVFNDETPFPGMNALLPCLGAAAIIWVGSTESGSRVTTILSWRPFVFIGLISYSLYLVHWPILVFTRYALLSDPSGWQTLVVVAASVVSATLSWWYVERPFRNPNWANRRQILTGGGIAMAIMAAMGVIGVRAGGFPFRSPSLQVDSSRSEGDWKQHVCFLDATDDMHSWSLDACTRAGSLGPKVFLWGDSFAAHYVPGFIALGDHLAVQLVQYTYAGCPPLLDYESLARPNCHEFNAEALPLMRKAGIGIAILSARWELHRRKGLSSLRKTVETLRKAGISVFVVGQTPEFAMDVRLLAYRSGVEGTRQVLAWKPAVDPHLNDEVSALASEATFVNPMKLLCDAGLCAYRTGQVFLYSDFGHLSQYGATLAVERLFPFLLQPGRPISEAWPVASNRADITN
jgi:peptidoglycan/LPS O-acetylase OafA/YrhL